MKDVDGTPFVDEENIKEFFDTRMEKAKEIFSEYVSDDSNYLDSGVMDSILESMVYQGFDLDEIESGLNSIINNSGLESLINKFQNSFFDDSIDTEGIYNQLSEEFDRLKQLYPEAANIPGYIL